MSESDPMRQALSSRARRLERADAKAGAARIASAKWIRELRRSLLGGETHYTERPGMLELRAAIGARLGRGADDVVVTAGLEEALFVALLSLEAPGGSVALSSRLARHAAVVPLAGLSLEGAEPPDGPVVSIRCFDEPASDSTSSLFDLVVLDEALFAHGSEELLHLKADSIALGSLDALAGLASFRVGFASAPSSVSPRLRSWKQALSICTAAPSQRAALLALAAQPERGEAR